MTTDLDQSLRGLADDADHPGLDDIGDRVLARLRADGVARGSGIRLATMAAIGAVTLGLVAANPVPGEAAPASLAGESALAPSSLLLAAR